MIIKDDHDFFIR